MLFLALSFGCAGALAILVLEFLAKIIFGTREADERIRKEETFRRIVDLIAENDAVLNEISAKYLK